LLISAKSAKEKEKKRKESAAARWCFKVCRRTNSSVDNKRVGGSLAMLQNKACQQASLNASFQT
jgi:hypothetical protein